MSKPSIRCSSLDRVLNCSHSLRLPVEKNDTKFSTAGTEEHDKVVKYFNEESVTILDENTWKYIEYVKGYKIEQELKAEFDQFILTGHPDAWSVDRAVLEIVDLKSGYIDISATSNQLKGYAALILRNECYDWLNMTIKFTIIQNCEVKSIEINTGNFLNEFEKKVNKSLNNHTFELGDHCQFCPSQIHCSKIRDLTNPEYSNTIQIIKHKAKIKKTIDAMEANLLKEKPELFKSYQRRTKYWLDESKAPKGAISPAKALKEDLVDNSNIGEIVKTYWKLK